MGLFCEKNCEKKKGILSKSLTPEPLEGFWGGGQVKG